MSDSIVKTFKTCSISGVLCNCLKDCTKDDPRVKIIPCESCGNQHGSVREEINCKTKEILRLREIVHRLETEIAPLREMKIARDKNIADFNSIPRTSGGMFEYRLNPKGKK